MQDLQTENDRLHRILDIVDSQPDYVLCCTELGRITFASERTVSLSVKCNMMAKQHHLQRGENGSNNNDSGSNSDSSSGKNSGSLTSGSDSATSHQAFNIGNYNNRVSLETELNSNSCNTIEDNMSNSNRDDSILKHISQLLTPDSLNSTQDYISKVSQCVNQAEVDALPVCEISLADGNSSAGGNTQSTVGYLRVARLYRKSWSQHVDKEEYSNLNVSPREGQSASSKRAAASSPRRGGEEHHATKRSKRNIVAAETEKKSSDSAYPYISAQSLEDAAAVLSALTGLSSQKTNISSDNLVGHSCATHSSNRSASLHCFFHCATRSLHSDVFVDTNICSVCCSDIFLRVEGLYNNCSLLPHKLATHAYPSLGPGHSLPAFVHYTRRSKGNSQMRVNSHTHVRSISIMPIKTTR